MYFFSRLVLKTLLARPKEETERIKKDLEQSKKDLEAVNKQVRDIQAQITAIDPNHYLSGEQLSNFLNGIFGNPSQPPKTQAKKQPQAPKTKETNGEEEKSVTGETREETTQREKFQAELRDFEPVAPEPKQQTGEQPEKVISTDVISTDDGR